MCSSVISSYALLRKETDRSSATLPLPALHHHVSPSEASEDHEPSTANMHDITSHTVTLRHRVLPSPAKAKFFFSWCSPALSTLISSPRPRNETPKTSPALDDRPHPAASCSHLHAITGITLIAVRHIKCQVMQQTANQCHNYRRCQRFFFYKICSRGDDVCISFVSLILAIFNLFRLFSCQCASF